MAIRQQLARDERAERLRRTAPLQTLQLGELRLTYLPDGAVRLDGRGWLPDTTDEVWSRYPEYLDESGSLVCGIGALLVEYGDRALLIDTGFGPQSFPAQPGNPCREIHGGALLDNLARTGRTREDIEAVAFTHLHLDHIGWAWNPAPDTGLLPFPVDYLVVAPEWTHRAELAARGVTEEILQIMAPRIREITDGQEIFPGVTTMITPGHTAGSTSFVISGGGRRVIAFGDAMHSPLQVDHPEWSAVADVDAKSAVEQRRRLIGELSRPDTIGFGMHFADLVFGHVPSHAAGAPRWEPVSE